MKIKYQISQAVLLVIVIWLLVIPPKLAVAAWQNPTASPPNGNLSPPVTTGSDAQTKIGELTLSGGARFPGSGIWNTSGNVGIGTTGPNYKLDVVGTASLGQTYLTNSDIYFKNIAHSHTGIGNTTGYAAIENASDYNTLMILGRAGTSVGRSVSVWDYLTVNGGQAITGTLTVGGGTGKVNAGTVDPIYNISGEKYATYLPAMTGQKEETAGILKFDRNTWKLNGNSSYSYEIDLGKAEKGSDLWLFYQVTDFGSGWDNLSALLTANFAGDVWYEKKPEEKKLVIYAAPSTMNFNEFQRISTNFEVSYRLTAPRFDHEKWPNTSSDSAEGFILQGK